MTLLIGPFYDGSVNGHCKGVNVGACCSAYVDVCACVPGSKACI